MTHVVGVFAALGPAIGILIVDGVVVLFALGTSGTAGTGALVEAEIGPFFGFLLLSVIVGYGVGLVPAAVAGLICAVWSPHLRSAARWISACALTCFFVTFSAMCIAYRTLDVGVMALAALIGAAAGMGCGWVLRRSRLANGIG